MRLLLPWIRSTGPSLCFRSLTFATTSLPSQELFFQVRLSGECVATYLVTRLKVSATCVRVPVVTGHSLALHAVFDAEVTRAEAQRVLSAAPGVVLTDDPERGEFPTPADIVGTDPTWVGRVRQSMDDPHALELFVCGDNLRKGAALNAAQIAELLVPEFAARTAGAASS